MDVTAYQTTVMTVITQVIVTEYVNAATATLEAPATKRMKERNEQITPTPVSPPDLKPRQIGLSMLGKLGSIYVLLATSILLRRSRSYQGDYYCRPDRANSEV